MIRPKNKRSPDLFFDKVKCFFCWAEITLFFHPYHVKFKQWICLNLIFEQSIVNGRDVKIKIWIGATNSIEPGQTAQVCRLAWLKSGAKALRVNPNKIYLHIIVWIVFLFCHMFQIKRLSSACSVLYLQGKMTQMCWLCELVFH